MALCECGCGGETKGGKFLPGHDQKLRSKLEKDTGGLLPLRSLVEAARKYAEDDQNPRFHLLHIAIPTYANPNPIPRTGDQLP
jgi:hypothetical protein